MRKDILDFIKYITTTFVILFILWSLKILTVG